MMMVVLPALATLSVVLEPSATLTVPEGWSRMLEPVEDNERLTLSLALHVRNREDLEARFWSVSNPKSADYAKYLTLEEIRSLYAPSAKDIASVLIWLAQHNARQVSVTQSRDWIQFSVTAAQAKAMFGASFERFEHGVSRTQVLRSVQPYSIPAHLAGVVAFVSGMHRFPSIRDTVLSHSTKRQFGDAVTPQVIWETYLTNGTQGKSSQNLQSVAQFLGQFYDPNDLNDFQKHFKLPSQKVAKVVGPNDASNPGVEATLDIEYITGTAPGVPTWFYSTKGLHQGQEPFVDWAQAMNNASLVPFVVSVSYGDPENTVTLDYAQRLDVEFQKLALRGVSILYASGDDGVGCHKSACVNEPNWPASSPYVTAVGGFVYSKGKTPEGDSISSGGFSTFYARPSYQDAAVKAYLSGSNLPPRNQYNSSGRAIPDVSSYSENVIVVGGGSAQPVAGTSCAAPVFSGVISLINDALLQKGKKSLGFLNQALYGFGASNPDVFIDITKGSNGAGCCKGFNAEKGWDPITGWGGPNFPNLLAAFSQLQD